jgi:small subunit ribosomal protein S20
MPNIKSAAKRAKTSEEKRMKNKGVMTLVSTLRNDLYSAISAGDAPKSQELFRKYCSTTDKAMKKGIIKRNAADRRKARATHRMTTLK